MKLILLALAIAAVPDPLAPIELPGAHGGIGFDDLRFAADLHKVLVPAGRTGRVDLVDPRTRDVDEIAGFSTFPTGGSGHGDSTTSADSGAGLVFASDRTRRELVVADPSTKRIVARMKLRGTPDYVRWVQPIGEVWVTEPGSKMVETFRVWAGPPPALTRTGTVDVRDGPEALEIDGVRRRAYTNTWHDETIAIDLASRRIVGRWNNGCQGARGLALDAQRGFVFVGCDEGRAVVLDAIHDGRMLASAPAGDGVDVIAYSTKLSHLYVPGGDAADLTVLGVGSDGAITALGKFSTAKDVHCVTADDLGNVYVCDPEKGRLLTFRDPFPASGQRREARTGR